MSVKRGVNSKYNGFQLNDEYDQRIGVVCEKFGLLRSDFFRRLVDYGLPAFERSNRLPALRAEQQREKDRA